MPGGEDSGSNYNPFDRTSNEFAAADLASELAELTRQANRANATTRSSLRSSKTVENS